MTANSFEALGLPARPDLTDEQVRQAWRIVAAATHPDRADGGDLARYTAASAAFAQLRTPWARSEAYADLAEAGLAGTGLAGTGLAGTGLAGTGLAGAGDDGPVTSPLPVVPGEESPPVPPRQLLLDVAWLPERIFRGRPVRLLIRAAVAVLLSLAVLSLIPGTPAATADVAGLVLWFALTARRDLAPPPER